MPASLTEKQDKAFLAHLEDLFRLAQERYQTRFTGFLYLHQLTLARQVANRFGDVPHLFYAGHPGGERQMLGVFAPYTVPKEQDFPIGVLTACFRKEDSIGHRDLLGALMGLEIRREAIGDLLLEEGRAVLFVAETVASVVENELVKVGRHGVKMTVGFSSPLPEQFHFSELPVNVSSLRLDCMVSAITGFSREKAAQTIRAQLVSVNGAVFTQTAGQLCEGDIISIRGVGKFVFAQITGTTKKGRLQVLCKRYV